MRDYCIEDFLGEGWFPIETDGIKKWAWSKEEAFLNFPASHKGFSLEFSGCSTASLDLIVYHKEKEINSYKLANSVITINIPFGILSCKIKLDNSWTPKEILGTSDERALGICLHNINSLKLYLETCDWLPDVIEMSLTGICNINPPCVMCVTRNLKNRKEQFYLPNAIIDKMKPYLNYAKIVSLHGGEGEPLLSPRLFDVISMINTEKVHTMFATNGLLLTKEMSEKLISAGLKEINFSIDAASHITYSKIRNNNGFYALRENIKQLVSLKEERDVSFPHIIINMVLMKENISELPDFIDFAHELRVSNVQVRFLVPLNENYEITTSVFNFNYFEQRIDPNSDDFKQIIGISKKRPCNMGLIFLPTIPRLLH